MSNSSNSIGVSRMAERMIPSIDNRLTNWAEWKARDKFDDPGIGYGRSVVSTLMESKGVVVRSTVPASSMPDAIFDTDKAVRHIEKKKPELGQVIREHYLNMTSTPVQKHAACGCSSSTYHRRLAQAHQAVQMMLPGGKRSRARELITVRELKKAG